MSLTSEEPDSLLASAANAQRAGNLDVAEQLARKALGLQPDSMFAKFMLGVLHARKGDADSSVRYLSEVLEADPRSFEALISISNVLRDAGRRAEALGYASQAVDVRPNDPQARNNQGRCLMALRRLEEAAAAFNQGIRLNPGFAAAHHNLGRVRQLEGRDREAADAYSRAVELAPSLENFLAFGRILLTLYDLEGAARCASECLTRYPTSAEAHLILCGALIDKSRPAEANVHLQKALELDPERKEALQIATRQRPLGYVKEANENLRLAIEQNPRNVLAYGSLMHNQKVTDADRPLVERAKALLEEQQLSATELISIHYGLGKALEDLKEYEGSMRHYDEANRISREIKVGDVLFDRKGYAGHIDRMIEAFTPSSPLEGASGSKLPVLIVGTMRSGTTLAEQILSSHPAVAAAGEQLFWTNVWRQAVPDGLATASRETVVKLGREYEAFLQSFDPEARRVTDKMPGNYMFLGLIHQALPNARIIHIRRLPIDNCVSIWATPNHIPPDGDHNKADLVFVYRQYMRLMEHWRRVLPADRLLEIDYEELVSNPEPLIRHIVEFCGLDWQDACLHPEENKRMVATPSAWQVRQPVYKTSVERWKRFEPFLGEFEQLVGVSHPATE